MSDQTEDEAVMEFASAMVLAQAAGDDAAMVKTVVAFWRRGVKHGRALERAESSKIIAGLTKKAADARHQRDAMVDGIKHANGALLTLWNNMGDGTLGGKVKGILDHLRGTITDERDGTVYRTEADESSAE